MANNPLCEVMDPESMKPVPRDAETIGEIMMRGNIVMKGMANHPQHRTLEIVHVQVTLKTKKRRTRPLKVVGSTRVTLRQLTMKGVYDVVLM